jgi:steroid Delta-isomerase
VDDCLALLHRHVERLNAGVRTGDFAPMVEAYAPDAELVFEGVPVGPFHGAAAIAKAYREQPPDDEILLLDERREGDDVVAGYAWSRDPEVRAGDFRLTVRDGRIARVVVSFAKPP